MSRENKIEKIELLRDNLEPYYDHLDDVVENIIKHKVSDSEFKYFEACRFKLKAIWYIHNRIEKYDAEYKNFLDSHIKNNELDKLTLKGDRKQYFYYPFYEAMEFENLLAQGKSCLDCFSKAIGSIYNESPGNIEKLLNVLKQKPSNEKIDTIIDFIQKSDRLSGIVIDPKKRKEKSVRDLITHREKADIYFSIRLDDESGGYELSKGALLNMKHKEILLLPNYLVTEICSKVWFHLLGIIENCFLVQFDQPTPNCEEIDFTRK